MYRNQLKSLKKCCNIDFVKGCYCTKKLIKEYDIKKLRNIGILAHIDAGKTTTTERMLFYSGTISRMGEVHHGNTVTDFMEQERDRGITIRSAAVTFPWKKNQFNLIDTPGHIDFTMEVEQTLNVLDGAIIVLDGSAGVEAQTHTVWRQSDKYNIPRIVFVNKMDRQDADLEMCCKSIESKLGTDVIALQLPLRQDNKLIGLVDLLTLEKNIWDATSKVTCESLSEKSDGALWTLANEARLKIIDKVSEYDDDLANKIIESESLSAVNTVDIVKGIRKIVLERKAVPVLCGSAYKNIGIQPLMDGVVLYLPSPNERNKQFRCFEDGLCARVFKILHDKQRGPLVFCRVYSGQVERGQKFYNIHQKINEQSNKLLIAYADDYEEIGSLNNGNIAVLTGLKNTITGDILTNSATSAQRAQKKLTASNGENLFDLSASIPEPVFFCSIEPPSLAYQTGLELALAELQREDPSLRVTHDHETGQTVLAGMGELHLEIIKDRILKEYKIDADLGPLQIAYREAPMRKISGDVNVQTQVGNSKHSVGINISLIPVDRDDGKGVIRLDKSPDAASLLAAVFPKNMAAVHRGIEVGLSHGPKVGAPITNLQVVLHSLVVGRGTSETMVSAAATQCIQKLINESGSTVLEPIMHLEVVCPEEYLSGVMADLTKRRAIIQNVSIRGSNKMVTCETPLSELMQYSTTLRTITSGTGVFNMEFIEYRIMSEMDEEKAIESVRGF